MHIARKFELFLDRYRREDGSRWTGQDLHEATGGVVTRSYVSTLRKGKIESPGVDKLHAIAKAMGFPPELWFEETENLGGDVRAVQADERWSLSERVNYLFDTIKNGGTGEPYTSADVARMSTGDLTEKEVEDIRRGRIGNPPISQILALSRVFGVAPSFFLERGERRVLLDEATLRALGNEKSLLLLQKSLGLSDREKDMLIDMIDHLGHLRNGGDSA